jgi:hypothetical protein
MKRTAILLAATMTVGGLGLAAQAAQSEIVPGDAQIRALVARVVDDAMDPHDMRRLVTNFPAADMRHLIASSTYSRDYGSDLDGRIERICRDWRHHYGHDFKLDGINAALSSEFLSVRPAVNGIIPLDVKGNRTEPAFRLAIVHDMGTWSLRVPHSMTAEKLRTNLQSDLAGFDESHAQWPAKESEAYRQIVRRVLAAVVNKPVSLAEAAPATQPSAASAQANSSATASHSSTARLASQSTPGHWWQFWKW